MPPYSDLLKKYMLPLVDDVDVFDENSRRIFPGVIDFLRECGKLDEDEYPSASHPPIKKPRTSI